MPTVCLCDHTPIYSHSRCTNPSILPCPLGQVKRRRAIARRHCRALVTHLLERLLQAEEALHRALSMSKTHHRKTDTPSSVDKDDDLRRASDDIVAIFITLASFCKVGGPGRWACRGQEGWVRILSLPPPRDMYVFLVTPLLPRRTLPT